VIKDFEKWWKEHGQFCRAGGGTYEKTFAFRAWEAATDRATSKRGPKPRNLPVVDKDFNLDVDFKISLESRADFEVKGERSLTLNAA
jgi:hypothetical protein